VSIISVLVACTLLVVVLGATLGLFEGFIAKAGDQSRRTDSEDVARTAADRIARNLRNLASPTPNEPKAVDFASGSDIIFKTVDPADATVGTVGDANATHTQRVRYCLDPQRQLQQQTQTWTLADPPPPPSNSACPGSGWTRTAIVASSIANGSTPVFTYDSPVPVLTDISQIHIDLLVDTDPVRLPPPTRLSTGVFLRNQNRRPTASFAATKTTGGFVLNGSASEDPEGDPLDYTWYDGAQQVGTGITYNYTGLAAGSGHQLRLEVTDPGRLVGVSAIQEVKA